ncbi:hypothetical protein AB1K70_26635 [Bremerella sp. JC770]|uniref:hypothetical protein n=1 Tax=Bremerella sp. JC770 TaxID=3232137 RepID=UPI003458BB81
MNDEEKKILAVLTEATKDLKPKQLIHVQAGDVATICRLAAKANPTTSATPGKTGEK